MTHEAIRKALAAGPTPGPWTSISRGAYWDGEEGDVLDSEGNDVEQAEFVKPIGDVFTTRGQMRYVDANYIAACNPEAIAALLADRDRLAAEVEALHGKLHAMLKHCPDAECYTCSAIICPHGDAMHFHHDGCPTCTAAASPEEGTS